MIFTDLRFVLLFVLCWISFCLVPRAWRAPVIALFGAAFYTLYAGRAMIVILVLILLAYLARYGARLAAAAGLIIVAVLLYYKVHLMSPVLPGVTPSAAALAMPLGLSYLAFELLHVIIEQRRRKLQDVKTVDLLAFSFFAPARIAGPIKRFPQFIEEMRTAEVSSANVYAGLLRVISGLAKKYLIADVLALTVAESLYVTSTRHAWTIVFAYSLQIYIDFSAYSDIAIGFARMLGIRLPENFRWPYFSANIREFWERWHITLSQWVRDYIFVPVGRGLFRTRLRPFPFAIAAISYLLTFLTVGAWHGLTAGFLIWGAYHGILLTLYQRIRLKTPPWIIEHPLYRSRLARGAATAVTFLLVTIGWVPFMLPLSGARKMLAMMFGAGS
jgi:alginate O-acetyltransferase complex protein AlgI